jgi:hypothetical protein
MNANRAIGTVMLVLCIIIALTGLFTITDFPSSSPEVKKGYAYIFMAGVLAVGGFFIIRRRNA